MPGMLTRLTCFRIAAWSLGAWPALELIWRLVNAQLGANPVEFIEHHSGIWGLRLLLLSLAMSPLRQLSGWSEFIQVRRLLGLWAYAWVCLHFATYLVFDLQGSPSQLAEDLIERTYITLGFAAWLLLLPLAITSTQRWQQRLKRRWKALHRLIYVAVLLGGAHFFWLVKSDLREPLVYLAIIAVLLLARVPRSVWQRLPATSRQA